MNACRLVVTCFGLTSTAALAQVPQQPTAQALELARLTRDALPAEPLGTAINMTYEALRVGDVTHGRPCDRGIPACDEAARHVAEEMAPAIIAEGLAAQDNTVAAIFDSMMSPADIAEASRFAHTPAGHAYLRAIRARIRPSDLSKPLLDRIVALQASHKHKVWEAAIDRFYAETAQLPRDPENLVGQASSIIPSRKQP